MDFVIGCKVVRDCKGILLVTVFDALNTNYLIREEKIDQNSNFKFWVSCPDISWWDIPCNG